MTNCGNHAGAGCFSAFVEHHEIRVITSGQDDGRGLDALVKTHSLELLGMTDRVRALISVSSPLLRHDHDPGGRVVMKKGVVRRHVALD